MCVSGCMFGLIVTLRTDQSPSEASLMVQHDKDLHMQSVQRFWRVFMCTSLCHILMLLAVGSKLKFKIACRWLPDRYLACFSIWGILCKHQFLVPPPPPLSFLIGAPLSNILESFLRINLKLSCTNSKWGDLQLKWRPYSTHNRISFHYN